MTDGPLVSVIIPTYNRADRVGEAIESALDQTYDNLEIIVVDDCSSDNTEDIVQGYDKVRYVRNSSNQGAPRSRNKGVDEANGKYVNFLDDDDILYEKKVEKQVTVFEASEDPNLGIVTCGVNYEKQYDRSVHRNIAQGDMYDALLTSYCLYGTHHMLVKAAVLDEVRFDPSLRSNQEYDFEIRAAEMYTFDYVGEVLCEQRDSDGQISTNFRRKIDGTSQLYEKHKSRFWNAGLSCYVYNHLRFSYLAVKYRLGLLLGISVYDILP